MIFRQIFDKVSSTYTYLIGSSLGGGCVLIDPVKEQTDVYLSFVEQFGLRLVVAMDTHTHADHITALGSLRERSNCITMMGSRSRAECVSTKFREGETIRVDDIELKALFTPGHTDDSFSLVMHDRVFTGDALLIRSTGRTDFQNGSARAAYDSIFNKLLRLPDTTFVYPGHDYNGWTVSTINEERLFNPRLQIDSVDEYIELMGKLKLPSPKLMDIAIPSNLACGKTPSL